MAQPKHRTSKARKNKRRGGVTHKTSLTTSQDCEQCGAARQPHRACPSCGYYKGRQVLTISDEE